MLALPHKTRRNPSRRSVVLLLGASQMRMPVWYWTSSCHVRSASAWLFSSPRLPDARESRSRLVANSLLASARRPRRRHRQPAISLPKIEE